jgi:hypothetical protein
MSAKLVSGRVEKISSANVSADRYQFLSLREAEPDLGLPASDGQVLASNTQGGRYFVTLNTDSVTEGTNLYYTNARVQSYLDAGGYQTAANILANVNVVPDLSTNTTTDLAEGDNLYYTNARVGSYLSENDVTVQSLVVQGDLIVQGNTTTLNTSSLTIEDKNILLANGAADSSVADGAGITINGAQANIVYRSSGDKFEINKNLDVLGNVIVGGTLVANISGQAAQVETLDNFTTNDLAEGNTNLYFTTERARGAFTEGTGIAISANGIISTRGDDTGSGVFNSGLNLAGNLKPTGTYQSIKTFSSTEGNAFIVYSLLATNKSSNTSYISARVNVDGNTILLANLLKLPPNSSTEIFRKPQVFKVDDSIEILSLDQNQTPAANLVNTYMSYQGTLNTNFNRNIRSISDNQSYLIYQSSAVSSVIESINLVNLNSNNMPVDVYIADNNDEIMTYLVSNLVIPPYTSVEICEYPKVLLDNTKLYVQKWDNPKEMSVFVSSKITSSYDIIPSTTVIGEGDTVVFDIVTNNVQDGTVLYYEVEQI